MDGIPYSASFQNVSVSALQDLFELLPAANRPCRIVEAHITQGSDMGDAEEEGLRMALIRGNTTSGSGGSAATEIDQGDHGTTATAAVEVNNTTEASAGTEEVLHEEQVNMRVGLHYVPLPKSAPKVRNAEYFVVRLLTAPADAMSMSGTLVWEEL